MDLIIYTGFGFPGRDLLFTRSCDALIIGCGRIGTIHEFTIAFEEGKPIGILEGEWTMDEQIRDMIEKSNRPADFVIYDSDPKALVSRIMEMVEKKKDGVARK
jgi:predicted Rossmann-fold nucleotide-binding protein